MFVCLRARRPCRGLASPGEESVAQPGAEGAHVVDVAVPRLPAGLPAAAGRAAAVLGAVGARPGGVVGGVAGRVPQSGLQGQSLLPGAGGVTWT